MISQWEYGRFVDRRYADNVGRFADTYNCIKTAFHDTGTDILANILARIVAMMSACGATSPKFCVGPNVWGKLGSGDL